LYDLDLAAKKPLRTLPGMATGLAWSPDGKQLAVADSRERNLTLWGMPGEATAAGTAVATPTLPGSGAPDVTPTPAIPTDPTQAAIASMTVIPPPTAIPGLQATHVARATAFPFPTSDPSTVQADAYTSAVAITRRGGVELELRLAGDTYLAGETGRAEVVVRNTTAQRVFAGNLQFSVQDEEGRAVDLWPMMPQMRAGWPGQNRPGGALGMLPPVEPGATITSTFPFTLPPIEQSGQHRYTARASAQISRADIQHSDRGDGVPVEVQTEDIPLRITEPGPQQHLKAELQNNHPRYTLRVTSADGRPVTGPLWGAIEVSGRMAGPLHDSPDGAWTFDWSGYFTQEGIHLQVRAWVAARGYLPAVITQTLSGPASSPDSLRTLARWQTPLVATDSVAWSADGLRVAAASDSRVALYDAASGTSLGDFTVDGPGRVEGISWSRDGRFIAVRTFDGTGARGPQAPKGIIWVVDAETLRGLYSLEMPERILKTSWVWLPYAPILAATDGFRISYWDEFLMRAPGASSASSLQPTGLPTVSAGDPGVGPNMVSNLAWSPNTGRLTLATSQYKRVRLWDVVQGKEFASFDNPGGVIKMEWQPGKELLAVLAVDENDTPNNVVLVWDVTTGTPRELWTIKPGKQISSIAWSSKNILAVSTHGESRGLEQGRDSIALYDGATGTLLREVEGFATDLAWSADGQTLAIANARDGVVTLLGTGVRGTPQPIPTVPPTPDSVPTPNS
jgi:WD40 repeat protein